VYISLESVIEVQMRASNQQTLNLENNNGKHGTESQIKTLLVEVASPGTMLCFEHADRVKSEITDGHIFYIFFLLHVYLVCDFLKHFAGFERRGKSHFIDYRCRP
jgi:hypothetical protein